ncbi:hypothetical protein BDW02DRAFT_382559 [Decorospora gaudefroyi]|uniref:Uncharacterized protein n=1 Tax=Decorospora gaudefroyi TaxID=184978 RepID=A0A6A5KJ07_9PLEO|nr:hypothetical protein BDW02DRAFT_382559 [Decorospora gaudefroyi]
MHAFWRGTQGGLPWLLILFYSSGICINDVTWELALPARREVPPFEGCNDPYEWGLDRERNHYEKLIWVSAAYGCWSKKSIDYAVRKLVQRNEKASFIASLSSFLLRPRYVDSFEHSVTQWTIALRNSCVTAAKRIALWYNNLDLAGSMLAIPEPGPLSSLHSANEWLALRRPRR